MINLPIFQFPPFFSTLFFQLFFNYFSFSSSKQLKIKNLKFPTILLFLILNFSFYCYADDLTSNNTLTNQTDAGNGTTIPSIQTTTINWWGSMAVTQPDSYIADDSTVINTTTDSSGLNGSASQDSSSSSNTSSTDTSTNSNSTTKNKAISSKYQKYILVNLISILFFGIFLC
ncbi:unnamed protein product [Meloidogyne enterolobii]|uniref:Uncharacterized protein n=2 Tax=Meloidogyne enterolobii TaxID=390850 RepID=A0ACB0Y2D2_MELEN